MEWSELTGSQWILMRLTDPQRHDLSTPRGDPELMFFEDGTAAGSTGCNRFQGRFVLHDSVLTHQGLAMTRKGCKDLTQQETQIVCVLGNSPVVHVRNDELTLATEDGRTLRYRRD